MAAPSLKVQLQGATSVSADNLNTYEQTCDTVAELRGFVGAEGVQVSIRGLTAPNDGGAGSFYWNASAIGPDNGVSVIVPIGSDLGAWILIVLGPFNSIYNVRSYGATGNGLVDDTNAIKNAAAAAVTAGGGVVYIPTGNYKCSSNLSFNLSLLAVKGDPGSKLNFSGAATSITAVTLTGNATGTPYNQSAGGVCDLEIVGPGGTSGSSIGILWQSAAEAGPSHTTLHNVNVNGFVTSHSYSNNSYLVSCYDCDIFSCGTAVSLASGTTNCGENIRYYGGCWFNGVGANIGLNLANSNSDVGIYGTSIDGIETAITQGAGVLVFHGHIENTDQAYVCTGSGAVATIYCQDIIQNAGTDPLFVGIGGSYLGLIGGLITPNNSTAPVVNMPSGSRYFEQGVHWDYSGSTLRTLLGNYAVIDLNGPTYETNLNVTGSGFTSLGGSVQFQGQTVLTSVSTLYAMGLGSVKGMLVLTDVTSGGSAVYLLDFGFSTNAQVVGTAFITGLNAPSFSSADWNLEITGGTAPRTINWGFLRTG